MLDWGCPHGWGIIHGSVLPGLSTAQTPIGFVVSCPKVYFVATKINNPNYPQPIAASTHSMICNQPLAYLLAMHMNYNVDWGSIRLSAFVSPQLLISGESTHGQGGGLIDPAPLRSYRWARLQALSMKHGSCRKRSQSTSQDENYGRIANFLLS